MFIFFCLKLYKIVSIKGIIIAALIHTIDGGDPMTGVAKFFKQIYQDKLLYIFILPAVIFTIVFNYRPMYGLLMAFQKYNIVKGIWGSEFIGFDNFKEFLANPEFYRALKNTVLLSILNLTIVFPIPIIFAILLNEFSYKYFKKVVQTLTYLPYFISWVIISGLLYKILDQDTGIANVVLQSIGMDSIGFFREPKYFYAIFITATVWNTMGWNSILYLSAMTSINPELYEAATADGAGRIRRIWHITLPGIMPTIVVLFIIGVGAFFTANGSFQSLYSIRNVMVSQVSDTIDVYSYFTGIRKGDYGYATAIGLTQSVLGLLMLFSTNKIFKKTTGYSVF